MSHFTRGFQDELVKTARLKGVRKYVKRLKKSKDLRSAIARSAALGGGTGALTALAGGDNVLSSAVIGALGGSVAGGTFPAWFQRGSMRAPDEKLLRRALRRG